MREGNQEKMKMYEVLSNEENDVYILREAENGFDVRTELQNGEEVRCSPFYCRKGEVVLCFFDKRGHAIGFAGRRESIREYFLGACGWVLKFSR